MVDTWQSGFVAANGVTLHYTRTGGDKPVVVLAHGVTDAGPCWGPVAEALQDEYDLIMVDARGHGASTTPESGYGPDAQAEDLAGLITGLGLHKPAVLGHSMGAATALVLAGLHPELPGAILLEDPPHWWTGWYATPEAAERVAGMRERALHYKGLSRDALIAVARENNPTWPEGELGGWAEAKLAFHPNVLQVFNADNPDGVDWAATISRITCPVLLIAADPELGGIVTEESAAALKALAPQTEVAHIPEAGHNIRREQAEPFLAVVRRFLADHAG